MTVQQCDGACHDVTLDCDRCQSSDPGEWCKECLEGVERDARLDALRF